MQPLFLMGNQAWLDKNNLQRTIEYAGKISEKIVLKLYELPLILLIATQTVTWTSKMMKLEILEQFYLFQKLLIISVLSLYITVENVFGNVMRKAQKLNNI